jgi:hypothetical protein
MPSARKRAISSLGLRTPSKKSISCAASVPLAPRRCCRVNTSLLQIERLQQTEIRADLTMQPARVVGLLRLQRLEPRELIDFNG